MWYFLEKYRQNSYAADYESFKLACVNSGRVSLRATRKVPMEPVASITKRVSVIFVRKLLDVDRS